MGQTIVGVCNETGLHVNLGYNESFVIKRTKREGGNKRIYYDAPFFSRVKKSLFFSGYYATDDLSNVLTLEQYKEKTNVISKA